MQLPPWGFCPHKIKTKRMFVDANIIVGFFGLLVVIATTLVNVTLTIAKIKQVTLPNGGGSIIDKVNDIQIRLAILETKLGADS